MWSHHVHEAPAPMMIPMLILSCRRCSSADLGLAAIPAGHGLPGFLEGHTFIEEMNLGLVDTGLRGLVAGRHRPRLGDVRRAVVSAAARRPRCSARCTAGPLQQVGLRRPVQLARRHARRRSAWMAVAVRPGRRGRRGERRRAGTVGLGRTVRGIQTGQVQTYAWVVFGGLIVVALAAVLPVVFGFRV